MGTTAAKNIAEIDTTTGAVVPGFQDNASGAVNTLLAVNGHLLAGGSFKGINGSKTDPYYASLSPTTGKDDGYLALSVSGNYVYPHVKTNNTQVYNQQLSPNGSDVLVEGTFTSVGGLARQQIFMLGLGASSATVTAVDLHRVQPVLRRQPPVLHPGRGLVAGRLGGLHRDHGQEPGRLDPHLPADRAVLGGCRLPGHAGPGHP